MRVQTCRIRRTVPCPAVLNTWSGRACGTMRGSKEVTMGTGDVLWEPPPEVRDRSRVGQFMKGLPQEVAGYPELWEWSTTDLAGFWGAIWDHFAVIAAHPPAAVLEHPGMPGTRWF